jgi:hypothetical protein
VSLFVIAVAFYQSRKLVIAGPTIEWSAEVTIIWLQVDREAVQLRQSMGAGTRATGHVARDEPEEEEIDGLRLPFDLNSHAAVSYVLQQQVSRAVRVNKRWEELAAKIPPCCKR